MCSARFLSQLYNQAKSNKLTFITTSRVNSFQINLHHCQATAANLLQLAKQVQVFFIQKPWTYKDAVRVIPPDFNLFVSGKALELAFFFTIHTTADCYPIYLIETHVVWLLWVLTKGNLLLFLSPATCQPTPIPIFLIYFARLLTFFSNKAFLPVVIRCDNNSHHTIQSNTNTSPCNEKLFDFILGTNLIPT